MAGVTRNLCGRGRTETGWIRGKDAVEGDDSGRCRRGNGAMQGQQQGDAGELVTPNQSDDGGLSMGTGPEKVVGVGKRRGGGDPLQIRRGLGLGKLARG